MRTSVFESDARPAGEILAERAKVIGLPLWRLDAGSAEILTGPAGWGPADNWLRSSLLSRWITRALEPWVPQVGTKLLELFPGCWLIPLPEREHAQPQCMMVAMVLGAEGLRAEQFAAICDHAELDATIMRTALAPLCRYRRGDHERLAMTLRWMHGDLVAAIDDRASIVTFSRQLGESYEHISHLYRLGRSIHRFNEPDEFVDLACSALLETLDFEWIAARLTPTRSGGVLKRTLTVAGAPPCDHRRLDRLVGALLAKVGDDHQPLLLEPDGDHVAAVAGAEVLAHPVTCGDVLIGLLLAGNKTGPDADVSSIDMQLLGATAEYLGAFVHSAAAYHEQRTMFVGTVRAITYTIEAKDRYTRGHSERVAHLAGQLAIAAGLDPELIPRIRLAGMLHDVGKIGVPEAVLQKPGGLSADEYDAVKRHPVIGYSILKDIEPLQDILPGVLYHHERWDGGGYPQGLKGTAIPLIARVLAVVDMFDAMSSDRSYQAARPRERVVQEIRARAGTQLDPDLAAAFTTLDLEEYWRMIARHLAQDGKR